MGIKLKLVEKENIKDSDRETLATLLKYQGKVTGDLSTKADRCKIICFAYYDGELAATGAIKGKTASDYSSKKADLNALESEFEWELGYIYTIPKFQGKGLATIVVTTLLEAYGDGNLMSSTEISKNPKMVSILESNNFRLYGKPWKSSINENYLGLFLRFK